MAYPTEADAEIAGMNWNRLSLTQNPITGERTLTLYAEGRDETRKGEVATRLNEIKTLTDSKYDSNKATAEGIWDVKASGWDVQLKKWVRVLQSRAAYQMPPNPDGGGVTEGTTVSEDVFSKTTEIQYFNQEAPPTPTLYELYASGGILRVLSAAVDAMKKWRVELRTVKSKEVKYQYSYTAIAGGKPIYFYVGRNVVIKPTFTLEHAGYELSVGSCTLNPDGTWNYNYTEKEQDILLGVGETKTINRGGQVKYRQRVKDSELVQDPNQKFIYDHGSLVTADGLPIKYIVKENLWYEKAWSYSGSVYKCFASAALAWAATYDGYPITSPPQKIADGLWLARWDYESPGVIWSWDSKVR